MKYQLLVGLWAGALCLSGCYPEIGGPLEPLTSADSGVDSSVDSGVLAEGVPCDVQQLVASRCLGCHGSNKPSHVPISLLTLADFQAKSPSDMSVTVAAQSLQRMRNPARPMPPSGLLSEAELAPLAAWVQRGVAPGQSCDGRDAGTPDAGRVTPPDAGPTGDGLPCEVESVVAQSCRGCHDGNLQRAPMALLSRAHFLASAPTNPNQTVGVMAVSRMRDPAQPMPPAGLLPSAQVDLVDNWVKAGMPAGTCQPPDAGPDPFAEPPRCSSNSYWTSGNSGSSRMNPGSACISCHIARNRAKGREEAPGNVGGTVYPTAHEPDLCVAWGLSGAVVVLTGADGQVVTAPVNSSGNFYLWDTTRLARPYRAKVVYQNRERVMATPQMSGDCNSCHTQAGTNGAPGRILAP